ncbi:MAG: hypothetical protein Q9223_006982, partial [Gallowayella weberi]
MHGPIKKGSWNTIEDQRLENRVALFGHRWTRVAQSVGARNADQSAKRWHHSLDPGLDRSEWMPADDARLMAAVAQYGRVWKAIGTREFPGRSPTELKNRYIIVNRRRKQHGQPLATSTTSSGKGPLTPATPDDVGEDSESMEDLSDDDGPDQHGTAPMAVPANIPATCLGPLEDFDIPLQDDFDPIGIVSAGVTPLSFPFQDLDLSTTPLSQQDDNDHARDVYF